MRAEETPLLNINNERPVDAESFVTPLPAEVRGNIVLRNLSQSSSLSSSSQQRRIGFSDEIIRDDEMKRSTEMKRSNEMKRSGGGGDLRSSAGIRQLPSASQRVFGTAPSRFSRSFTIIAGTFIVLLLAATITFAALYYSSYQTIIQNRVFRVVTGDAAVLSSGFQELANHRIGLITNPTAVVYNVHIIDWMFFTPNSVNMSLVALFGPEHGLRGTGNAGAPIDDSVDERTGLPIFSLYGNVTAPTPKMLQNVTALVYDIQDIGCRFFTYISTMGLSMQSAAQAGIPFIVLDRPNPLGDDVSGWVLDPANASFIGEYPIPVQYGLSAGELAQMIKGEQYLPGLDNLDLRIVPLQNYQRGVFWYETTLPWISPSPNIVDFDAALLYPGTGFFESFNLATEGRGTLLPFKMIGAPWANSTSLANQLNAYDIPGVTFLPTSFTPHNISEMSDSPKFLNQRVYGVHIVPTHRADVRPVELGVYLIYTFYQNAPNQSDLIDPNDLALHAGTTMLYNALLANTPPSSIIYGWKHTVTKYLNLRQPYLLY